MDLKYYLIAATSCVVIFCSGLYFGSSKTPTVVTKTVYKDRIVEKVVYKDRIQEKVVNRVIHIHDKKNNTITTIKEVLNDKSSVTESANIYQEDKTVLHGTFRWSKYSLGAFVNPNKIEIQSVKPFIQFNVAGPFSVIAYSDLKFKDYGLGLSISF